MKFLDILAAITSFQLVQLGVILLSSKQGIRVSNRILATFMFWNALLVGWFAFGDSLSLDFPLDYVFYFFLAPYLFMYVKSLCVKDYKRTTGEFLHWIPALVAGFVVLLFPDKQNWLYLALDLQIASYLFFIFRILLQYRKAIREHYSTVHSIDLTWLLFILLTFVVMWSVDLTAQIFKGPPFLSLVSLSINFLFATAIVFRGLKHPQVFSGIRESVKYQGSAISPDRCSEYAGKLQRLMEEEKPFLNPDLTLKDLAGQMDLHPKSLSQVINSQFQQNFFDFVNRFRINEAKNYMIQDNRVTVLEVLYAVGYNSKSAFNAAFKKAEGATPTEFRKLYKKGIVS